jgi:hypothetical protein
MSDDLPQESEFWNASRSIVLGFACLGAFLVFIYFISP